MRRVKEGTSAVLLQSSLDENWWADSMECYTCLRNVQDLRWENSMRETFWETTLRTDHSVWFIGWVCERPVKNPSNWKESLTGIVPWIRSVCGWNLEGWHIGCRHWGVGNDGRIRNLLEKTQCKGSNTSQRKRKFFFLPQMDESHFLEEIRNWEHPPWYDSDQFKERVILIFLDNHKGLFHHLMTHFWMLVKHEMIFGPCQETSYTANTLNPESNFTRWEKNHSLFHWNTLTSPELLIRTWMLCKNVASMMIGTLMGQEICLVHGQVSHNLLYSMKKLLTDILGPGREIDEKTAYIQARSSMARVMEVNGKERQAEGKAKMITWKTKTR